MSRGANGRNIRAACVVIAVVSWMTGCANDSGAPASTSSTSATTTTQSPSSTSTTSTTVNTSTTAPTSSATVDAAPGAVTGLVARTGGGSGEVVIVWAQNPESDVVRYVVSRADTPGGSATNVGTATRAQVEDFARGAPFVDVPVRVGYYRVRGVDAVGNIGPPSPEACGASPGNSC